MSDENKHLHTIYGAQTDITPKGNLMIWAYFFVFGMSLFITLGALTLYFRYEVEREHMLKVGVVKSKELLELREHESQVLLGTSSVIEGKKAIQIDSAMERVVKNVDKGIR